METSLYEITFKDGRRFRVYCANSKQNRDMLQFLFKHQKEIKRHGQIVLACGIHTFLQFNKIIK
jgi:hypothetical protein